MAFPTNTEHSHQLPPTLLLSSPTQRLSELLVFISRPIPEPSTAPLLNISQNQVSLLSVEVNTQVQTKSFQLQICKWDSGQLHTASSFLIHLILHTLKFITTKTSP